MRRFFDTNILVYANSDDPKSLVARSVMAEGGFISVQVLNECVNVMRNKMRYSWKEIGEVIVDVEETMFEILPLTRDIQHRAFALSSKHDISIYDSLILASAMMAECDELISEDFQHNQRFGTLRIRNPFVAA